MYKQQKMFKNKKALCFIGSASKLTQGRSGVRQEGLNPAFTHGL